jgi:hypothetical protein
VTTALAVATTVALPVKVGVAPLGADMSAFGTYLPLFVLGLAVSDRTFEFGLKRLLMATALYCNREQPRAGMGKVDEATTVVEPPFRWGAFLYRIVAWLL